MVSDTLSNGILMKPHKRDSVEAAMVAVGVILRSQKPVDATQAWFWTPDWQRAERQASEDIRGGRARIYKSESDFLRLFAK